MRLGLLGAGLVLVCLFSVAVGSRTMSISTVWDVLTGVIPSGDEATIIWDRRVPRTLIGLVVGIALGVAGALMQSLTRNPLADPALLGVDIGASTAVVASIAFFGITTVSGYIWFAFLGAAIASVLVYVLGSTGRTVTPERMVLAGAAISATLGAFVAATIVLDPAAFQQFRFWQIGSFEGRDMAVVLEITPFIATGLVVAAGLASPLNAIALGDETGRALGVNLTHVRIASAVAITLLCGAATAAVGPIAFIGLTVPHMARAMVGPDLRWVLPISALLAPVLLLGADVVGRLIIAPREMEVGIITAFIGAPVFIALCRRRKLAHL
ncbi:FecCD family ABC transporter permease [Actinokineospora globicatena]|uniref:FecCD family ABC transporter permease n=1 Tax=Actinokineospora globicatena TaxID=103729 RepID=UPI0020A2F838|nr:iron chelate uptake ABC transporter family permease subunit [Actinokineospora globicatena]MCP2305804.1 iron complex transport system permease protein [Actinokineospora globicatena]GLW80340.1 iron ABC transporter permease [Actinokineospora globicatena]GLW87168.1 iron ABC transporter permease [Actinokineospora globicatena]